MSESLPDLAALLDRLVYPDLGIVLCQDGERDWEREAYITYLPRLSLPWVCRRRARLPDGSVGSSTHATRLEAALPAGGRGVSHAGGRHRVMGA